MRKFLVIGGATAVSLPLGFALLAFSPASCACLSPLQHLVLVAGLDYDNQRVRQYTAVQIENGLNGRLLGESPEDYFTRCAKPSRNILECRINLDESALLSQGFDVVITVKPDGSFVHARVKRSWSWL